VGERKTNAAVAAWLAIAGKELTGTGADLEFSVRLSRHGVRVSGRCSCWTSADPEAIGRIAVSLGAPAQVLDEQARLGLPVRQGIGIDASGPRPQYRLYMHGRDPVMLGDRYRSWRWHPGDEAHLSVYSFHFLPETATGLRPARLVAPELRPMVRQLVAEDLLRQCSGFWLRRTDGVIDELDLAFPWHPLAGSLPGLTALARHLGVTSSSPWQDLPIRHASLRETSDGPVVTLYVRGPTADPLPASEDELHERATRGALAHAERIRLHVLDQVPAPPRRQVSRRLGRFYGGDPATWQHVLGTRLHYHHGLFDTGTADMDAALDRAVTELYPFIPAAGRIYDIGCGWGGPLAMWIRDLRCPSLGVTISRAQFRYASSLGLPVRWADAERTLPPGYFDCVIMLESFEHIAAKRWLLEMLRMFTGRLVMRVNCQDRSPASTVFGGTMHMISSTALRTMLESTGWRITHWRDRRAEAMPSVTCWHTRSARPGLVSDAHLTTLRMWTTRVLSAPAEWAAANPLVEVVAEPEIHGSF
jgi:hypothetical protein